jgi:hypothetical protein
MEKRRSEITDDEWEEFEWILVRDDEDPIYVQGFRRPFSFPPDLEGQHNTYAVAVSESAERQDGGMSYLLHLTPAFQTPDTPEHSRELDVWIDITGPDYREKVVAAEEALLEWLSASEPRPGRLHV